jgi:hypothetical protein
MANTQCFCRKYGMDDRAAIREANEDNTSDIHTPARCFVISHQHAHDAVQAAYAKLAEHGAAVDLPPVKQQQKK